MIVDMIIVGVGIVLVGMGLGLMLRLGVNHAQSQLHTAHPSTHHPHTNVNVFSVILDMVLIIIMDVLIDVDLVAVIVPLVPLGIIKRVQVVRRLVNIFLVIPATFVHSTAILVIMLDVRLVPMGIM